MMTIPEAPQLSAHERNLIDEAIKDGKLRVVTALDGEDRDPFYAVSKPIKAIREKKAKNEKANT